jgi:hypothetical protein
MHYLGYLIFPLQIAVCVHIIKTGRPWWWFWIIWFAPGLGCLVYLIVEVLPGLRISNFRDLLWRLKTRAGRAAALREQVEESPSVENRRALAAELKAQGKFQEATEILRLAATGVFKDDAYVLKELAEAQIGMEDWKAAREVLARIKTTDPILIPRLKLLQARVLAGQGDLKAAEKIWKGLEPSRLSEEPVYRLALAALQAGDKEEARRGLKEIRTRYRKGNAIWRRDEKQWFKLAGQKLGEMEK